MALSVVKKYAKKGSSLTLAGSLGHCACAVSRDLRVWGQKRPHIWNPHPNLSIHYTTFMELGRRLRVVYSRELPLLAIFGRKFSKSVFSTKIDVWGPKKGLNVTFNFCNSQKAHPCVISRLLSHHASKSVEGSDLWVVRRKGYIYIYIYVCMYVYLFI